MNKEDLKKNYEIIENLLENKNFETANKLILQLLNLHKKNYTLKLLYARVLYLSGDDKKSKSILTKLKNDSSSYEINFNLGLIYFNELNYTKAVNEFNIALKKNEHLDQIKIYLAISYGELKNYKNAIVVLKNISKEKQNSYEVNFNLGLMHEKAGLNLIALEFYCKCIVIDKNRKEAYVNKGYTETKIGDYLNAIQSLTAAINLDPLNVISVCNLKLKGQCVSLERHLGFWQNYSTIESDLQTKSFDKNSIKFEPRDLLTWNANNETILSNAKFHSMQEINIKTSLNIKKFDKYNHQKIRLGYFSSDFREHPVSFSIAHMIELHDRNLFEVHAFSFNICAENDTMRPRLQKAFDHWHDVQDMSDLEVTTLAHSLEIDIAINLNGHTLGARNGIFAHRAAPIQINYLGYPGTMGAEYMDYILADRIVIPEESQKYYSEKVIYLPDCYHVTDSTRYIPDRTVTRADYGLPEDSFIYACFNASYKITPEVFESWMRILKAVDGSVLCLIADSEMGKRNLKKEANKRGIKKERLIFINRMNYERYLNLYSITNLFLDTYNYNAGTTASDALWCGLPILTMKGESFASSMASSLLNAIGIKEELITYNSKDYEEKAINLAKNPEKLEQLKKIIIQNRKTSPLFDTNKFTKNLEKTYLKILKIQ